MPRNRTSALVLVVALAAGLLAFGAKLLLMRGYGSDVPYMDEWDAIGRVLLVPESHGDLHASNFLEPQNEHRVVLSRLLSYGLLKVNGQWDGLLEMTADAVIHAALCAALLIFARRLVSGVRFACVAAATTLLFVLAFDWENTLQGLQSQVYFLEWAAFGLCVLCVPARALSARWWAGWLVGAVGLGAMASGFVGPAAALALLLVRCASRRSWGARDALAAALLLLLCVVGVATVNHVPGDDVLRVRSAGQWVIASATALSWPEFGWPAAFLVMQAPIMVLAARRLREGRLEGDEAVLVALGLWAWMQVALLAYGRGNMGLVTSPRYTDLYAFGGSFVNVLALAVLWRRGPSGRAWGIFALLWVALFSCGLWTRNREAYGSFLTDFKRVKPLERVHVRAFLDTGDVAALRLVPPSELPYPRPDPLAEWLSNPAIRDVLPPDVRLASAVSPEPGTDGFGNMYPADHWLLLWAGTLTMAAGMLFVAAVAALLVRDRGHGELLE
jgi:hypothetical protein